LARSRPFLTSQLIAERLLYIFLRFDLMVRMCFV
jgi:hypothetical protein